MHGVESLKKKQEFVLCMRVVSTLIAPRLMYTMTLSHQLGIGRYFVHANPSRPLSPVQYVKDDQITRLSE